MSNMRNPVPGGILTCDSGTETIAIDGELVKLPILDLSQRQVRSRIRVTPNSKGIEGLKASQDPGLPIPHLFS